MKDLLDVHMHTLASGHAYSTPREMVAAGRHAGLALIGMSEHGPQMRGSCHEFYFCNFRVIRPEKPGIEIIMGAELNARSIPFASGLCDCESARSLYYAWLNRAEYRCHDWCHEKPKSEDYRAS